MYFNIINRRDEKIKKIGINEKSCAFDQQLQNDFHFCIFANTTNWKEKYKAIHKYKSDEQSIEDFIRTRQAHRHFTLYHFNAEKFILHYQALLKSLIKRYQTWFTHTYTYTRKLINWNSYSFFSTACTWMNTTTKKKLIITIIID